MKKLFLISLFIVIFFSAFIFAENVSAATCDSQNGICTLKIAGKTEGEICSAQTNLSNAKPATLYTCTETTYICCLGSQPPTAAPTTGVPAAGNVGAPSTGSGGSVSLVDVSPVGDLTGAAGIATLIGRILKAVLGLIGAFALLMFVYGGFLMLASGGKPDAINKGKGVLVWAIIGLIVIIGSYVLSDFIIKGIMSGVTGGGSTSSSGSTTGTCPSKTVTNCNEGSTKSGYSCCDCGSTPETTDRTCQEPSSNPTEVIPLHCGIGSKVCGKSAAAPATVPTTDTPAPSTSPAPTSCTALTPKGPSATCTTWGDANNYSAPQCYDTGCNQATGSARGACFANCARDNNVVCETGKCLSFGNSVICCGSNVNTCASPAFCTTSIACTGQPGGASNGNYCSGGKVCCEISGF